MKPSLHVHVDIWAGSKGQQFLKTFYAGRVKVCVWGVITDFVLLPSASYPCLYTEIDSAMVTIIILSPIAV